MTTTIPRPLRRWRAGARSQPGTGIWAGLAVCVIGMALIAVAWGGAAASTDVTAQLPWVVAAGMAGLGVVVIGLAVVSAAAKRREAAVRTRQLRELSAVLTEIRALVEEQP